jgi:hypothetical protein
MYIAKKEEAAPRSFRSAAYFWAPSSAQKLSPKFQVFPALNHHQTLNEAVLSRSGRAWAWALKCVAPARARDVSEFQLLINLLTPPNISAQTGNLPIFPRFVCIQSSFSLDPCGLIYINVCFSGSPGYILSNAVYFVSIGHLYTALLDSLLRAEIVLLYSINSNSKKEKKKKREILGLKLKRGRGVYKFYGWSCC